MPALGGDTDSILAALGYSAAEIGSFRRRGVI
jgi:crotonobetainyl-CoA:carnitine CoA-transferase CaiB-like acyl-CoA transferase